MIGCRISEGSVNGISSLVLENDHIKVVVLAGKGSDIWELRHKPSDTDILWKTPWGVRNPNSYVPDTSSSHAMFLDLYPGGWQELLPNGGAACTYRGAELGFHGELCKIPWEYQIVHENEKRVAVRFYTRTVRIPFRVEKTLRLERDCATLFIEETVTNEGTSAMDFMWGHHPAFGPPFVSEDCRLFVPARSVETAKAFGGRQILPAETHFKTYPLIKTASGENFDLSRVLPPSAQISNVVYLSDLEEGWSCLVNENSRIGVAMHWDLRVFPYVWLVQEYCGTSDYPWWGRAYLVSIEPQSSIPAMGLEKAIDRGTNLTLASGKSISTELCVSTFLASGSPASVSPDGTVRY